MTGHLLGAAGAIEAIFCLLSMRDSIIPPTINLEDPDNEYNLDLTPNNSKSKEVNYSMSNSFGFGGTNVSLIFKKFSEILATHDICYKYHFLSLLLQKPNGDSFYFFNKQDSSLSDVFEILEEREIFFPKIIKSIFVVTGADQKIYQGNYQIKKDDSIYEIFKKIYFGKIMLKKFIISEGSQIKEIFFK